MRNTLLLLAWLFPAMHFAQTLNSPHQAIGYQDQADSFMIEEDYETATVFYKKAANLFEELEMWEHYYSCLSKVAEAGLLSEQYEEAKKYAKEALWGGLKKFGTYNENSASAAHLLGEIYQETEQFEKAESVHKTGLGIHKSLYDEHHPSVANSCYELGVFYTDRGNYQEALLWHEKALAIRKANFGEENLDVAQSLFSIGNIQITTRNFQEAFKNHQQALDIRKDQLNELHLDLAKSLGRMGYILFLKGDMAQSVEHFEQELEILNNANGIHAAELAQCYYYIAAVNIEKGQSNLGLLNAQKALTIIQENFGADFVNIAIYYNCIAQAYRLKGENENALQYLNLALESIVHEFGENHPDATIYFENIGVINSKLGNHDLALNYFLKAYKNSSLPSTHPDRIKSLNNIGRTYFLKGDNRQAEYYYQKALSSFPDLKSPNVTAGRIYLNLVEIALNKEQPQEALEYCDLVLYHNSLNPENQEGDVLLNIASPQYYLKGLKYKGKVLLELAEGQPDVITQAYETFLLGDQLIDQMRGRLLFEEDRLEFNQVAINLYEGAIESAYQLFQQTNEEEYLNQAFIFSEKSKANAFLQANADANALRYANLPDSLLRREKDLQQQIQKAYQYLGFAQSSGRTPMILQVQEQLAELKHTYFEFIQLLEKQNSAYYHLKYNDQEVDLARFRQQHLDSDQALIEYFLGDSVCYLFTITDSELWLDRFSFDDAFVQKSQNFRKALANTSFIHSPDSSFQVYRLFVNSSFGLYHNLMQPAVQHLPASINRLMIVPDGPLGLLPFEILIQEQPSSKEVIDYRSLTYLLKRYEIAYTPSLNLLVQRGTSQTSKSNTSYLGFAPAYKEINQEPVALQSKLSGSDSMLEALPATNKSVEYIASLLNGVAYLGEEATEENFKNIDTYPAIIHLAMHGLIDHERPLYSKFAFANQSSGEEDNFLHGYELYNMEITADLAVLGACNTGSGFVQKGEGIMSLARAFNYAGCPSVVMSLWSIPDQESADLTFHFVEKLKKGMSKDQALQEVKLQYLDDPNIPPDRLHPYFWAGFTTIGDPGALKLGGGLSWMWWLAIGIGLVLLGRFFLLKKGSI